MTHESIGPRSEPPASRAFDSTFLMQLAIVALSTTAVNAVRPMVTYRSLGLGAGAFEVGLLAAVFSIAPVLLAVAIGRSIDRIGEAWFIRAAMLAVTVGALLAASAGSLALLAISQVVTGLGHVTSLIAGQALVANRAGRGAREHRYGFYSTMASFGHLAGPLVAVYLVGRHASSDLAGGGNPQAPAFLAAALAAGVAFGLAWLLPGRRPLERPDANPTPVGLVQAARAVLRRPEMPFAMLVSMIVVSSIDILLAYLPLYGEVRGLSVGVVGVLLAVRAGSSMVSRVFMGYLIERLGRSVLLVLSMGMAAVGLLALPLTTSVALLVTLMVLIGMGLGLGQPMTMAWVANRSPRAERATALGVRLTGNRSAVVVMPVVVGALAGVTGVSAIFWVVAVLLGAGAVVASSLRLDPGASSKPEGRGRT